MRAKEFLIVEDTSDPSVVKTQEKLRDLGYDLGPYGLKGDGVDGVVGPYTQVAMDAYAKGIDPKNTPNPDPLAIQTYEKTHQVISKSRSRKTGRKTQLPVDGPVSSPFGHRTTVGKAHGHNGTDFAVPTGTQVVAPESGVVTGAGSGSGGEGIYVTLDTNRTVHKFFHLSKILVQVNDQVNTGDVLALSGNTGYSTGPHLHWETHVAGTPVDPMRNVANQAIAEQGKASRALCTGGKPDHELGASQLASCKSQGLRARDGEKSHLITAGKRNVRVTVGGKRIKGKKYGGPLPDYGTRKNQR